MGKLLRALSDDGLIKISVLNSKDVVEKAKEIHNTSNVATAALGRLLTANLIMASEQKEEIDRVCLNIKSNGEIGMLATEAYQRGSVKGFVSNPNVNVPLKEDGKLDVAGALGNGGTLSVIKDIGLDSPQVGTVELLSGEIADDISYYFLQSEQIPTVLALGVLLSKEGILLGSGGYMVQLMPDHTEETVKQIEENVLKLPKSISMFFATDSDPHEIFNTLFSESPYKIIQEKECEYKCDCSRYKVEKALISLGKEQLENMIKEEQTINIKCHFCNKEYNFNKEDMQIVLNVVNAVENRKINEK